MRRFFRQLWQVIDALIDVIIWLHHVIMLYLCLAWLLPLIGLVFFSWLIFDLRPLIRGHTDVLFLYSLSGFPPWLCLCLYAAFAKTPQARGIAQWIEDAPSYAGFVLLGSGGLLWAFGVI
ncbi:MAG: hypothetical protein ACR2PO_19390 [Methyloligellaceae bacterium]